MRFSHFFIDRPIFAGVLSVFIALIGAFALPLLPLSQYPDIAPPTIAVTATYPGASAETLAETVAAPIEQEINGVEGMLYMTSSSTADGMATISVTFEPGTDLDAAQVLVQNRVALATPRLPEQVRQVGVTVNKQLSGFLLLVALTSDDPNADLDHIGNFANSTVRDRLLRIKGVGGVQVFGGGFYSMRVWIDPGKASARNLTSDEIVAALRAQNVQAAGGALGQAPNDTGAAFQLPVQVEGRLADPEEFANIVIRTDADGRVTRVRDIGRVELGAQDYGMRGYFDGKRGIGLAIIQQPGANALSTAAEVMKAVEELKPSMPQGVSYSIPYNPTEFVEASVASVQSTLFEAVILVVVVIMVFLQTWRAAIIPILAIPVALVGTFAVQLALGYSLNSLSLFALVLAVGIVVDDAIVVVEGAAHNIEKGMSGHDASIAAMNALMGPIIGITLVLMAVFLPASFLPGLTGQMYAQFALVIAATALISAVNAATLKPTQCAMWLRRPVPPEQRNFFYRGFNAVYDRLEGRYTRLIDRMVHHSGLMALIAAAIIGGSIYGMTRVATGFLPIEDQGYLLAAVQLPDGASLGRTQKSLDQVEKIARAVPGVERVITIAGISPLDNSASLANAGVAYIMLKDWGERGKGEDLLSLYTSLNAKMSAVTDGSVMVLPPPPIQGIGNAGGFTMQIELRDGSFDLGKLENSTNAVVQAASTQSAIQRASTPFRASAPQYKVTIDREKVQTLLLTTDQVFQTLATYLGSSYVDQFNKFGRVFQIYVQGDAGFRMTPDEVLNLKVRNQNGDMVPLGTVLTITPIVGPSLISLYNLYPSASIVGVPAKGFSSGDTMQLMDDIAAKTLPPGVGSSWTALSFQEKLVGGQIYYVFALAMLLVYLVLAGQYESWYTPLAVLFAVPLSLIGPVGVMLGLRIDNNLYVQIGLVLLIALSAKNAILIVEVARELRAEGKSIMDSAVEAARARFRPILMTSFAFILGVAPLVLATGAGASARKSIGITVFSGMIASTCLAVIFVPSMFVVIQRFEEWRKSRKGKAAPAAVAPPHA